MCSFVLSLLHSPLISLLNAPFFLSSGFPFFTVASTRSPAPAAGRRFSRPFIPFTAMTYRFLAPVLSAQFMTAPTGRPRDMRNFAPAAPFFPRDRELDSRIIFQRWLEREKKKHFLRRLVSKWSCKGACSSGSRQLQKHKHSIPLTSLRHDVP